jgi:transposase
MDAMPPHLPINGRKRTRPNPQHTPTKEIARAQRREEVVRLHLGAGLSYIAISERLGIAPETISRDLRAVQLHLRDGLTIRETGERLGVSHCTVIRDLRATVAESEAG